MGLSVIVGIVAEFSGDDEEPDDEFRAHLDADFERIRRLLAGAGLPDWREPDLAPGESIDHDMYGYSGLHYLRRLAANLAETGELPPPLREGEDPARNRVLRAAYDRGPSGHRLDHLIQHSDCEGYYVPVEFDHVLADDELEGYYLGSSQRLLEACLQVAAALRLPLDAIDAGSGEIYDIGRDEITDPVRWRRHGIASMTCLQLIDAARRSISTGAAICFC